MLFASLRKAIPVVAFAAWALLSALPVKHAFAGWPERTIRIVVPFAPGGGTDVIARTLAQEMAKDLGGSIIIENKPGAGTIIGTQAVAASEPDGYTLLMATFANAVNPTLYAKLPYDPHRDFAAVGLIARSFNIVVVNAASPIKSIADLIAAAKAIPTNCPTGPTAPERRRILPANCSRAWQRSISPPCPTRVRRPRSPTCWAAASR